MKVARVFLLSILFLAIGALAQAQAQSFETGLSAYQQKNYQQAAKIFTGLDTPEGYLFSAKALYALGRYNDAQANLNNMPADVFPTIRLEMQYTQGLIAFQQKQFADALTALSEVSTSGSTDTRLKQQAEQLYDQILAYLTGSQRLRAYERLTNPAVRFDVLESAMGRISYDHARELYAKFEQSARADWREKSNSIKNSVASKSTYENTPGSVSAKLSPPDGTVYTIGMAMPAVDAQDPAFNTVKAMYGGALLAAEEYNNDHSNTKAFIRFMNTGSSPDNLKSVLEQFSNSYYGDALIGPLYSEQAKPMVGLSSEYRIPALAPLANANLNANGSYLFQANPTFAAHGRAMAQFAVQQLDKQNFAVIANAQSNGAESARAFKEEVERLGGDIRHYFVEDLRTGGFGISQYTDRINSGENAVDAVYAPFTGSSALTLIDLLTVEMRAYQDSTALLGSQEWQNVSYSDSKYRTLDIYFTEGFYQGRATASVNAFKANYSRTYNSNAGPYSMLGYDVARFLLDSIDQVGNPDLLQAALANHPLYNGLIKNIFFQGSNTNESLKILHVGANGELQLR